MTAPGKLTRQQKERYRQLFAALRKRKLRSDDQMTEEIHATVFERTNCLTCAQCCKTHPPLLIEKDIDRIARHLNIPASVFVSKYVLIDEDNDWVLATVPCSFLEEDNTCSIYEVRPQACRQYPHTNRKKLYQIEAITLKNAEICPAVVQILDSIASNLPL